VAALVEHVGGKDEIPRRAFEQALRLAPADNRGLELELVPRCILARERDGGGRPVRREDVRSTESRGERRQCKAAAELDDLEVCDGALRDRARQRVAARPSLGPVGQELLALERLLVEQGLGVARPEDRQRASWQLDAVLDEVELFHLRSACNEAATPWTPPCRIVK